MDNIKAALTVRQFIKINELANLTDTHDLYDETGCVMNSNEYGIRLLHHNVQSLNNKLLDNADCSKFKCKYFMFYGTLVIRSPNECPKY